MLASAQSLPRVGLLGNPSDLYGGRGLGFTFDAFVAEVTLHAADAPRFAFPLLRAGWEEFVDECGRRDVPAPSGVDVRATSTIPRQVGLAGSSALLIAELRALSTVFDVPLTDDRVAELAWRAENERLGTRAGPLDRLVQAHEGLLAMDFARAFERAGTERMDADLLPACFVAWVTEPGDDSGAVHDDVWTRHEAGDPTVRAAVEALARNADDGRAALLAGDRARFCDAVDRNFDLRASIFTLRDVDVALVRLGRGHGAATKYCGSGGAALVVPRAGADVATLEAAYRDAGFGWTAVRVATTRGGGS